MSAQITPSPSTLDSSINGLRFMSQNTTDPAQNTIASNVTQLATVLPTVDQLIAPTSFVPVSEESDESTSSSDNDDDDDSNSDNNGNGNDDDDDDNGDDDDDGGSSVSAGGTFVFVG